MFADGLRPSDLTIKNKTFLLGQFSVLGWAVHTQLLRHEGGMYEREGLEGKFQLQDYRSSPSHAGVGLLSAFGNHSICEF